jgi:parallel beta-helix repeat protein
MKINNKILISLLIVLIAAISLSAVSAADDAANNAVSASAEQIETVEYSGEVDMSGEISESAADATPVGEVTKNSTTWNVNKGATAKEVQEIIDNSSAGDTIKFAEGTYNWHEVNNTGKAISIPHTLNIIGNETFIYCDNGFTSKTGAVLDGTVISGLSITMYQSVKWKGQGIYLGGVNNVTIKDCMFTNGAAGIYSQRNTNITIQNCIFRGSTNESTIGMGKGETGTKAVNIMGGSDHLIVDNYFGADCLDGVSIASNAKHNFQFINNTFENNWYATFYGGGVSGVVIKGNTFNNSKVYDLGLKKAAGETIITNNTFITAKSKYGATPVYIEQGNTAHGAPSTIESITIENNTFKAAEGTNAYELNAVEVYSNGGPLLPLGTITITNNTYEQGITPFAFTDANWGGKNNTYVITPATLNTEVKSEGSTISFDDLFAMQLVTANGIAISNADVTITAKNKNIVKTINATTNAFGLFYVGNLSCGNWTLNVTYAGSTTPVNGYLYGASKTSINLTIIGEPTLTIKDNNILKGGKLVYILTDENNKPIENVNITINLNGKEYTRTTNKDGEASMNINLQPGEYPVTATCEIGDYELKSVEFINVESNIITKDITLFYRNGTSFKATVLNGDGTPVGKGKLVFFNINGVIYNRTTDSNGTATLGINLNPGEYTITTMYGGIEISNKVVVKPTLVTEDLVLSYQDGSAFNATVLDGQGKPISGETVLFNINGVIYNKTSNNNGVASLKINLNPGEYIITSIWGKYQVGNKVTVKA